MTRRGDVHVVPLNDLIDHAMVIQCACRPSVERDPVDWDAVALVVHHAADGREHFEDGGVRYVRVDG